MSILESTRHELRKAYGFTLMTPSPRGWEVFPTPGALTHIRIIWAFSPSAPQVPGVTPGSPLCPRCFGHPLWRRAQQSCLCHMCSSSWIYTRFLRRMLRQGTFPLVGVDAIWMTIAYESKKNHWLSKRQPTHEKNSLS